MYGEIGGKRIVWYLQGSPFGRAPAKRVMRAGLPLKRQTVDFASTAECRRFGKAENSKDRAEISENEALSVSLRLPPPPRGEAFCTVKSVENASCGSSKGSPFGRTPAKRVMRANEGRENFPQTRRGDSRIARLNGVCGHLAAHKNNQRVLLCGDPSTAGAYAPSAQDDSTETGLWFLR